jgi:hypothetical protein|tara:strand:- start:1300 stop:1671 length:372 start_codon:yes stop_codon:yes gene_type:complete
MIKVVKYKSSWKAYRSGVEIPRSHFFRILNDQKKMEKSLLYEKDFMNRRFKLSCYMCGNSSLGLMSLAADNQKMVKYSFYGYLLTNFLKRIIKQKEVIIAFQEAYDMAKAYNDTLLDKGKIAI